MKKTEAYTRRMGEVMGLQKGLKSRWSDDGDCFSSEADFLHRIFEILFKFGFAPPVKGMTECSNAFALGIGCASSGKRLLSTKKCNNYNWFPNNARK